MTEKHLIGLLYIFLSPIVLVAPASLKEDKELPFCQRGDKFVTFRDLSVMGAGFLHKSSDFTRACEIAVRLNRTLIDYQARFTPHHVRDRQHRPFQIRNFLLGWSFKQLFDPSKKIYSIQDEEGGFHDCRFRFVSEPPSDSERQSILTLEYGVLHEGCPTCHNMIKMTKYRNLTAAKDLKIPNIANPNSQRHFSAFFKTSAEHVRQFCLSEAHEKEKRFNRKPEIENKLVVIHIRATDKPCVVKELNPFQLIKKIESFGINKRKHVLYVMTDLPMQHDHVTTLRDYFRYYYLFMSIDVPLFEKRPFSDTGEYLVYVTEQQLMDDADAIVKSYPKNAKAGGRLLGFLSRTNNCP